MLTVENLTTRYGISDRALRRRIDALGTVLGAYIQRGQNNSLLFQDGALAILDRFAQLQRDAGLGLADAAGKVRSELQNGSAGPAEERPKSAEPSAEVGKLLQSYEDRLKEQAEMISFLRGQLEKRDEQILALMPAQGEARPGKAQGSFESAQPESAGTKKRPTRWRAFVYLVTGK